ncbi:MAG: Hsp33 family molecular chaperone HslO [Lachnospiraceae bacterium]|nr:Hsp33 family molecular chaperone HslO [Lachnospiraceae bacterium]
MSDYIIRATAADGQIRAFAATTKDLVEKARQIHGTSPVATAGLGRMLTAAAMMGATMKGEKDILTLMAKGDGPLGGITVTSDSASNVKGYVNNPTFVNPPNFFGKFDVGGAIGNGTLTVIKDLGLKEPYSGQVALITGEIAEDLTYYFATSEQIPTSVALGVLMNKNNTVKQAGGFIIQLMPFASDEIIDKLENKIKEITSITSLLDEGLSPSDILNRVLGDFDLNITDTLPTQYMCNCSKERVTKAIISVGRKEITDMINEGKDIEVNCHFCNTNYVFSPDDLKKLLNQSR